MDPESLPPESDLHTMSVERDRTMEDAMAQALLGETSKSGDLGPVTYSGSSGRGAVPQRRQVLLYLRGRGTAGRKEAPGRHGQKLLEKAGYACQVLDVRQQEDGTIRGDGAAAVGRGRPCSTARRT